MMPREIRRLSEAEVLARWAELYAAGKHAGLDKPPVSAYVGRDPVWVEVAIPHDLYNADWNSADADLSPTQMTRAQKYAQRPSALPPGMASFRGRRNAGKAWVSDGNHRAYAAFLRGEPTARFYMPLGDWQRFIAAVQ